MRSECVDLELGSASEALQLPEGRHSAVFYDAYGNLVLRLRRIGKNRPSGGFIIRPCDCEVDGEKYCLCCRLRPYVLGWRVGERLWPHDYNPEDLMVLLRARLVALGHQRHTSVTWRSFRAGRLIHMSANRGELASALEAGEYAAVAVFTYLLQESVDHKEFLRQVLTKELEEPDEVA